MSLFKDAPPANLVIHRDAAILCPSMYKPKTIACLATRFLCVGIYGHVQIPVIYVRTRTIETNLQTTIAFNVYSFFVCKRPAAFLHTISLSLDHIREAWCPASPPIVSSHPYNAARAPASASSPLSIGGPFHANSSSPKGWLYSKVGPRVEAVPPTSSLITRSLLILFPSPILPLIHSIHHLHSLVIAHPLPFCLLASSARRLGALPQTALMVCGPSGMAL